MDLTPEHLAELDRMFARSEAELDQRIAELGAAVDGLPNHAAVSLLTVEYQDLSLDFARAILPAFMYRLIRLGDRIAELERTLASVRDKHHARTEHRNSGCIECGLIWPCPTYLAVKDAAGDTTKESTHP